MCPSVRHTALFELVQSVVSDEGFVSYWTKRGMHQRGVPCVQTTIAEAFFKHYFETNGLLYPRGRGATEELPLILLESSPTVQTVCNRCANAWSDIADAAVEEGIVVKNQLRSSQRCSSDAFGRENFELFVSPRETLTFATGTLRCDN